MEGFTPMHLTQRLGDVPGEGFVSNVADFDNLD
jgi:hypothetical protein